MKKKTFEISQIKNEEDFNALSIALNEKEQVSHLKINKENIMFNCIDIDALSGLIYSIDKDLIIKEVVDGQKREYDFATRKEKKHYFMFKNMLSEDDIYVLVERISKDAKYKNVKYDQPNKVLMLDSSQKDVVSLLRKELFKINPSMEIIEHRRPIRSQDVFNQKYLKSYMHIAILLVALALALITSKDKTWVTMACWLVAVLVLSTETIKGAWNYLKHFKFFQTDVVMVMALIMGVVSGAYIESCLAALLYHFTMPVINYFLHRSLKRIDEAVQMPEKGIRVVNQVEEKISLYDFEVGDIMVVYPGETIHISGKIQKGPSEISTYSNTSCYELTRAVRGVQVHSGDINVGENPIYIKVDRVYESTRYVELMNIASVAPVYESQIEKTVKHIARLYTPVMVILAVILGIVLPIINYKDYGMYIHVGAVLMVISGAMFNDQSTSLGMLAGFAKAFENGIIVESSKGLDSINATQTVIYDRFDGVEVTDEELELFRKLSHMGRTLIIFNDGPVALENDQYMIYNDLSVEEKLEKMESAVGPIVYIGDSFKDIDLLQKSYVGISRGGLSQPKVVENSDIVLIDYDMNKVYETFLIARRMRTNAIVNNILAFLTKLILLIVILSINSFPLWGAILVNIVIGAFIMYASTNILE